MPNQTFLENLLFPLSPQEFFLTSWGKRACVFGSRLFDTEFITSSGLVAGLADQNRTYPAVRLSGQQGDADPLIYTESTGRTWNPIIRPDRVQLLLDKGYTLRLTDVTPNNPSVKELKANAQEAFGCQAETNAYVNGVRSEGTAAHYDSHHVFAIQLEGEKRWALGDVVFENPTGSIHPYPNNVPTASQTLSTRRGQVLYIPPGLWHQALPGKNSLHLALSVRPPSWADHLVDVVRKSCENVSLLRAPLAMTFSEGLCRYEEPSPRAVAKVLEIVVDNHQRRYARESATSRVPQKYQFPPTSISDHAPIFEHERLMEACIFVWNQFDDAVSLYVRGSWAHARDDQQYMPWDLDLIIFLTRPLKNEDSLEVVRLRFAQQFSELPSLDLTVCTVEEIQNLPSNVLKRHLLKTEGWLAIGQPLLDNIDACHLHDFDAIWRRSLDIALKKLEEIQPLMDEARLRPVLPIELRRAAKSVLRLVGAAQFLSTETLVRDPKTCLSMVDHKEHDIRFSAETLFQAVQGSPESLPHLRQSAEIVIRFARNLVDGRKEIGASQ